MRDTMPRNSTKRFGLSPSSVTEEGLSPKRLVKQQLFDTFRAGVHMNLSEILVSLKRG